MIFHKFLLLSYFFVKNPTGGCIAVNLAPYIFRFYAVWQKLYPLLFRTYLTIYTAFSDNLSLVIGKLCKKFLSPGENFLTWLKISGVVVKCFIFNREYPERWGAMQAKRCDAADMGGMPPWSVWRIHQFFLRIDWWWRNCWNASGGIAVIGITSAAQRYLAADFPICWHLPHLHWNRSGWSVWRVWWKEKL